MLLSADRMLIAVSNQLQASAAGNDGGHQGSIAQSLGIALSLLQRRESTGSQQVWLQCQKLATLLRELDEPAASALRLVADDLAQLSMSNDLRLLEQHWRNALGEIERWLGTPAATDLNSSEQARLSQVLCAFEALDLRSQLGDMQAAQNGNSGDFDKQQLQHYLRDRFADTSITVTDLRPLSGGFGKQTFLFCTTGQALNGEFVMRRDTDPALLHNDCHFIDREFKVLQAMRAQGFPAPEALWLDTAHALLPGGNFLVMRRAPGNPGGSVFSAQASVPSDLSQTLAAIMAQLHSLPPLPELDGTAASISKERRQMSRRDAVVAYIDEWVDMFYGDVHIPSPTLAAQLNWLRSNIPQCPGSPVLLHGDIGFHNFLIHEGELSAVLDWEFAHIGDPAEELAYVKNTLGPALDWPTFMQHYCAAGGEPVDDKRLLFFQVWGQLRNALSANVAVARFDAGQISDAKMIILAHTYIPLFLEAAQSLIDQYGELQ